MKHKQCTRNCILRRIAQSEQRENHGSMVLHGVRYSTYTVLCRVISSRMAEPSCNQSSIDVLPYLSSTFVSRHL